MDLKIKKGLDIPIKGKPLGPPKELPFPSLLALNLDAFDLSFKVLVRVGDLVKKGDPLAQNKDIENQMFVSPATGVVKEIRRGVKRKLSAIIIETSEKEGARKLDSMTVAGSSREQILERLMQLGVFPHIRTRPLSSIGNPEHLPRAIFIKAIESAPFVPEAEMQVEGFEEFFSEGIGALKKLTSGKVHLVYRKNSTCRAFYAADTETHTIEGPHPTGNGSVHIHHISPITTLNDTVWLLDTIGVIAVGRAIAQGVYHTNRVISVAGEGIPVENRGYFKGWEGMPLLNLIPHSISPPLVRYISGDPLMGTQLEKTDFLGFFHTAFSAIPESNTREPFHFLKLGGDKYSATRAYLSGFKSPKENYSFTTNQHGEERPFIDGSVYAKVLPMRIPTMELIKAILAEDYDLAVLLGLLEVDPEDFALPAFICPSKIEMVDIVKKGIHHYSAQMGL